MQEIEAVVSGKVQGVTYRDFVQKKASALWVFGYVENIPDFKVKVVAQGNKEKLERFIEHLWKGPFGSKISDVSVVWREPTENYNDFSIHY